MNNVDLLNVPHANARDEQGKPTFIALVKNQIFSWYIAPSTKSLHVVATGGAVVPVLMTAEDFSKLYFQQPEESKPKTKLKGVK